MNLSNFSTAVAFRSLGLAAGLCAAVLVGCSDDDDSDATDGGRPDGGRADAGRDAGPSGAAGRSANAGSGGARANAGSGGRGAPSTSGDDAGVDDVDGGSDSDAGSEPTVDPNPTGFRDLSLQVSGFDDEVGRYVQVQLIGANGELLTSAVLNGLPAASYTLDLPDALPAGQAVELQVWADTFGTVDNIYDPGMDHAWTQSIAAGASNVPAVVKLAHGMQTTPPTVTGGDAAGSLGFMLMGTSDYDGRQFELRIHEATGGRLVARYLMPVPGIEVAFEVYGVLKTGTEYNVDFSIDTNNNGKYDDPPADAAWRRTVTATATGNNDSPGAAIWLWMLPPTAEYVDVGF